MPDPASGGETHATLRSRALGLVATWPRRIGALLGSAVAAFAVATFVPALWHETSKHVGLAEGPLSVAVIADPDRIQRAADLEHIPEFVIQRPIEQIGPPPHGGDPLGRYAWAHALGGIDAHETIVRLVIRGHTDSPVVLNGMRVQIVERRP